MTDSYDPSDLQGEYAGIVTRGAALIVDIAVIWAIFVAAAVVLQLLSNFFGENWGAFIRGSVVRSLSAGVIGLAFALGYHVFFWTIAGQTPGKALMGLRVARLDGGSVSSIQAVQRFFSYWLSAFLMLGFAWVLVDRRRRALHDHLSGTVVIYSWQAKVLQRFIIRKRRQG